MARLDERKLGTKRRRRARSAGRQAEARSASRAGC